LGFYLFEEIVFGVVLDVPMAAILGLQQQLFLNSESLLAGTVNCSTCCKWVLMYVAMLKGYENIVRSSCVGCGICAAVCPVVLKLLQQVVSDSNEILLDDVA
jgi:ferredoxin